MRPIYARARARALSSPPPPPVRTYTHTTRINYRIIVLSPCLAYIYTYTYTYTHIYIYIYIYIYINTSTLMSTHTRIYISGEDVAWRGVARPRILAAPSTANYYVFNGYLLCCSFASQVAAPRRRSHPHSLFSSTTAFVPLPVLSTFSPRKIGAGFSLSRCFFFFFFPRARSLRCHRQQHSPATTTTTTVDNKSPRRHAKLIS